jgi:regulator of protease activity HflC (stomatin/prohibitin superfamily)
MQTKTRLLSIVLLLGAAAFSTGCTYAQIGDGELGVVRTPAGVNQTPLQTGDWQIGHGDTVSVYNARSQQQDERLEVLAANGLKIGLDTSIRYHVMSDEIVQLDKELGDNFYQILIQPTLSSQARRVAGRYQPEEIYSTQREQIEKQIFDGVSKAITGRHVVIEAVLIRNVQLPDSIQAAINDKLQAEQAALKMKFVIDQQQADVQRQKIAADGEAEADHIKAASLADAKRIDAQATADSQKLLKANLNDEVLRYYQIQSQTALANSPNAKLVFVGAGAPPKTVLDMRNTGGTDAKGNAGPY